MRYFQVYPSNDVVGVGEEGEEILEKDWEPKISDIAHGLSMLCRFGGHIRIYYSVGQHSVLCAEEAAKAGYDHIVQLACLLHDGSEAYVQDVLGPIKAAMRRYETVEGKRSAYDVIELAFQERIALTFLGEKDASFMFSKTVNFFDIAMYMTESHQLRDEAPDMVARHNKMKFPPPLDLEITPWSPGEARHRFMDKFLDLDHKVRVGRVG